MQVTPSNTLQVIICDKNTWKYYKYFYVNGDFCRYYDKDQIYIAFLKHYHNIYKTPSEFPKNECVVCYDTNVGTYMGCCNFKNFVCIKCISEMCGVGNYNCPCCRENFIPLITHYASNLIKYNKNDNFHINSLNMLFKDYNEEEIKSCEEYVEYYDEINAVVLEIDEECFPSFYLDEEHVKEQHFSKIIRKIGFKPLNSMNQNAIFNK